MIGTKNPSTLKLEKSNLKQKRANLSLLFFMRKSILQGDRNF
ncbi:hypothetical protein APA_2071 [Pseudanabaena sp. lw0831]|nr:hypothetical protein APA_2071 [Pseudanabaena sp. lw0831]